LKVILNYVKILYIMKRQYLVLILACLNLTNNLFALAVPSNSAVYQDMRAQVEGSKNAWIQDRNQILLGKMLSQEGFLEQVDAFLRSNPNHKDSKRLLEAKTFAFKFLNNRRNTISRFFGLTGTSNCLSELLGTTSKDVLEELARFPKQRYVDRRPYAQLQKDLIDLISDHLNKFLPEDGDFLDTEAEGRYNNEKKGKEIDDYGLLHYGNIKYWDLMSYNEKKEYINPLRNEVKKRRETIRGALHVLKNMDYKIENKQDGPPDLLIKILKDKRLKYGTKKAALEILKALALQEDSRSKEMLTELMKYEENSSMGSYIYKDIFDFLLQLMLEDHKVKDDLLRLTRERALSIDVIDSLEELRALVENDDDVKQVFLDWDFSVFSDGASIEVTSVLGKLALKGSARAKEKLLTLLDAQNYDALRPLIPLMNTDNTVKAKILVLITEKSHLKVKEAIKVLLTDAEQYRDALPGIVANKNLIERKSILLRRRALNKIIDFKDQKALWGLVQNEDLEGNFRQKALEALIALKSLEVNKPVLYGLLESKDINLKISAAKYLYRLERKDQRAKDILNTLFDDPTVKWDIKLDIVRIFDSTRKMITFFTQVAEVEQKPLNKKIGSKTLGKILLDEKKWNDSKSQRTLKSNWDTKGVLNKIIEDLSDRYVLLKSTESTKKLAAQVRRILGLAVHRSEESAVSETTMLKVALVLKDIDKVLFYTQ